MEKPKKTTAELTEMIMQEIRKYPECDEISSVGITRSLGKNWDVAVTRNVPYITPAGQTKIEEIVASLRAKFDLI